MSALFDQTVFDAALNVVKTATTLRICSGTPTTATEADTQKLATVTVASGDYTLGAATPTGRQITVAAKGAVPVTAAGTPAHYCLILGSTLIARTEVNPSSPNLTAGSTVDIPTVTFSIAAPAIV